MFDLGKLGDMAKIAGEAKQMQEKQERMQREQTGLLVNKEPQRQSFGSRKSACGGIRGVVHFMRFFNNARS